MCNKEQGVLNTNIMKIDKKDQDDPSPNIFKKNFFMSNLDMLLLLPFLSSSSKQCDIYDNTFLMSVPVKLHDLVDNGNGYPIISTINKSLAL